MEACRHQEKYIHLAINMQMTLYIMVRIQQESIVTITPVRFIGREPQFSLHLSEKSLSPYYLPG